MSTERIETNINDIQNLTSLVLDKLNSLKKLSIEEFTIDDINKHNLAYEVCLTYINNAVEIVNDTYEMAKSDGDDITLIIIPAMKKSIYNMKNEILSLIEINNNITSLMGI